MTWKRAIAYHKSTESRVSVLLLGSKYGGTEVVGINRVVGPARPTAVVCDP